MGSGFRGRGRTAADFIKCNKPKLWAQLLRQISDSRARSFSLEKSLRVPKDIRTHVYVCVCCGSLHTNTRAVRTHTAAQTGHEGDTAASACELNICLACLHPRPQKQSCRTTPDLAPTCCAPSSKSSSAHLPLASCYFIILRVANDRRYDSVLKVAKNSS